MFHSKDVARYASALAVPHFGVSQTGRLAAADHNYIVVPKGASIVVQDVPQRRGGVRYVIDHRENASVVFRPGGMFGKDCLIAGELGTPRADEVSLAIWKLFSRHFFREFVKIGLYRVGPEALRLLHAGLRLSPDIKWSRVTDLAAQARSKVPAQHVEVRDFRVGELDCRETTKTPLRSDLSTAARGWPSRRSWPSQ